jgi:hypothetical protein
VGCLRHELPKLALVEARELFDLPKGAELSEKIMLALAYGMGYTDEDIDKSAAESTEKNA